MSSIPQNFIFNFSIPCSRLKSFPKELVPEYLDASWSVAARCHYDIQDQGFGKRDMRRKITMKKTEEKKQKPVQFDFRIGWHPEGLVLTVLLSGKNQPFKWDLSNMEESDGLHFVLDTRDVRDVQRGTRFCHRFLFVPNASEGSVPAPRPFWLPVHRAKAHPNPVDVSAFQMAAELPDGGYIFSIAIPAGGLTGYDPEEHTRLGFHYSLRDQELGYFNLQQDPLFPTEETPSLWSVLELKQ
ncbi:MAG: hypothetical protein Q4G69_08095 [Planctomycetia bacterium]|nr:hypothetical protein [Planctomycetia bacterium]